MTYIENPVTETERSVLYGTAQLGLPAALVAFGARVAGYDNSYIGLVTVFAASALFSIILNYRARDEFFDRMCLSGARWALGLLGVFVAVAVLVTMMFADKGVVLVAPLRDQMTTLCAIMLAFFAGFNLEAWREG